MSKPAPDYRPVCPHQWAVTESISFTDTDRGYRELTDFLPPTDTVTRIKAVRAVCLMCGERKAL